MHYSVLVYHIKPNKYNEVCGFSVIKKKKKVEPLSPPSKKKKLSKNGFSTQSTVWPCSIYLTLFDIQICYFGWKLAAEKPVGKMRVKQSRGPWMKTSLKPTCPELACTVRWRKNNSDNVNDNVNNVTVFVVCYFNRLFHKKHGHNLFLPIYF